MSQRNDVACGDTYLPGHESKGVHIIGLGRASRFCHIRENARVTEAANTGDAVFVDQDVCLSHELSLDLMIRACWMRGERTVSSSP